MLTARVTFTLLLILNPPQQSLPSPPYNNPYFLSPDQQTNGDIITSISFATLCEYSYLAETFVVPRISAFRNLEK
jgi:hypothetical protein